MNRYILFGSGIKNCTDMGGWSDYCCSDNNLNDLIQTAIDLYQDSIGMSDEYKWMHIVDITLENCMETIVWIMHEGKCTNYVELRQQRENKLKKEAALSKLTEQERELLGLV